MTDQFRTADPMRALHDAIVFNSRDFGIVQVRPFAIGGDPVWRTPVSMVTITPAGDGSWSPAVVVARGTMSVEQAEEVAAGLLAAAAAARYCGGRGGGAPIDLPPQLA